MSSKAVETSSGVAGSLARDSVYDFLYYDAQRLGSFLAQLDPNGHLQGLTQAVTVTESTSTKSTVGGDGGLPGVAKVVVSSEDNASGARTDNAARTYDPRWVNALNLLDHLNQRGMIRRGIENSSLGEFVLESGTLSVIDMLFLKGAWESPHIRKQVIEGGQISREGKNSAQYRAELQAHRDNTEVGFELIKIMPHSVQAQLMAQHLSWMTLDGASLTVPAGDLALKHGVTLAGVWHVLGVVDAAPDEGASLDLANALGRIDIMQAAAALMSTPVGLMAQALSPASRIFMGRPPQAYGMTPILIFREIQTAIT